MGLGPYAVWQMVDYPNKRTNYLGFPSVLGHCSEQQRPQQPDLPTVGQLAPRATRTLALFHFLASSSSLRFPSLQFLTVNSYSFLFHLAKSQSAQTDLGGVLFQHNSPSLFRWIRRPWSKDDLKWSLQMGLFWLISSPSVAPYRKRCNYDVKANKWPMFN